jgi:hypothetical protein
MAIYSSVPPPAQQPEGGVEALYEFAATRPGVTLSIPLDARTENASGDAKRKEPLRRDSLKRREALLKGKEGSRRRQRWENGET